MYEPKSNTQAKPTMIDLDAFLQRPQERYYSDYAAPVVTPAGKPVCPIIHHVVTTLRTDVPVSVRTAIFRDAPWFMLADVCRVVNRSNPTVVAALLQSDEVMMMDINQPGGMVNMVNECGLYSVVMLTTTERSARKDLHRWVTLDLLPKAKRFVRPVHAQAPSSIKPELIIGLAQDLVDAQARIVELEAALSSGSGHVPGGQYYAPVAPTAGDAPVPVPQLNGVPIDRHNLSVGAFVRRLNASGVQLGRTWLFSWMRLSGYLISSKGDLYNTPHQRYLDAGLFVVDTCIIKTAHGTKTQLTTRITPKGQDHLFQQLAAVGFAKN
jgi:anti-repressor protein